MDENMEDHVNKGMESLEEFYAQKKNEQDALRRLLEALENKSKNESTQIEKKKKTLKNENFINTLLTYEK